MNASRADAYFLIIVGAIIVAVTSLVATGFRLIAVDGLGATILATGIIKMMLSRRKKDVAPWPWPR